MFKSFTELVEKLTSNSNLSNAQKENKQHDIQIATAVLMIDLMGIDDEDSSQEKQAISAALQEKFKLNPGEIENILTLGKLKAQEATDFHEFTSLINQHFEYADKVNIIEHLWLIAYADNKLHHYEEHSIRKIADLLYVSHADFIAAKHKVLSTLRR